MLQLDKTQSIQGYAVYGDSDRDDVFYILPKDPGYRRDDKGRPVFKFIKYRFPIDRPDGKKGGGYCIFDADFTVPQDKEDAVKQALQAQLNQTYTARGQQAPPVQIGTITYTKGTADILLAGTDGTFVEKVLHAASPSLYGDLVTSFAFELTDTGATFFEQAMQGLGGSVGINYDVVALVKLPPLTGYATFNATEFYSFYQTISVNWSIWSDDTYRETVREQMINSKSEEVVVNPGGITDQKIIDDVRNTLQRALEDAIQSKMIDAITPVSQDDRKRPDGIDQVTRDISSIKIASFRMDITEGATIEWHPMPQGVLPNITTLTTPDGKPIVWTDYAQTIDLNDPFFQQLNVAIHTNADFQRLPIFSVVVHVEYNSGNTHTVGDYSFSNPNDLGKFSTYIEGGNWKYTYWYQVNYKDESKIFKSDTIGTDQKILTINVDDLGVLDIDLLPGTVNFDQVSQAQLTFQYEDTLNGVDLFEQQFVFDKNNKQQRLEKVIFQPRRNQYLYTLNYFMADGKRFTVPATKGRAQQIYINSPFSATKTVGLRAAGNLDTDIDTIFVDMKYMDSINNYDQVKSVALSKTQPFFDWSFPVISDTTGQVTYSGSIKRKDGTVTNIASTQAAGDTILVGDVNVILLNIQVVADLVDFTQVKLVKVALQYTDQKNNLNLLQDLIFHKGGLTTQSWSVGIKDATQKSFQWQANFYMADSSVKKTDPVTTSDPAVILDPSAVHA